LLIICPDNPIEDNILQKINELLSKGRSKMKPLQYLNKEKQETTNIESK
jgi:hypothetical protein